MTNRKIGFNLTEKKIGHIIVYTVGLTNLLVSLRKEGTNYGNKEDSCRS